jgi:hypothetical protein
MEQATLFSNIAPTQVLSKREIKQREESRRLEIAQESFERQTEIFKEKFESFLVRFLYFHKGERFVFPDVTDAYAKRKDLPQPLVDFRCVGFLARKYKALGRIRKLKTVPDKVSGRDIPLYEIL